MFQRTVLIRRIKDVKEKICNTSEGVEENIEIMYDTTNIVVKY